MLASAHCLPKQQAAARPLVPAAAQVISHIGRRTTLTDSTSYDHDMCDPGEGHTPVTQQKPPEAEPVTPPATLRYVFSDGKPVGIANTTNKYSESRPVRAHVTPFEKRLERKIAEETEAIAIVSSDIKQPSDTQ